MIYNSMISKKWSSSLAGYCVHSVYSAQKLLSTLGTSCKYNHIVFSYSSTY